jgi:AcrR family transcriptional regulator
MADTLDTAPPGRRRRSDARRSIDAILSAARTVLGERPDASMEDIATAAGVTRQTVYAHFPSRDALIAALLHAAGAETLAAIDAARLDIAPPADALRQFLDIGWELIRRNPICSVRSTEPPAPANRHPQRPARRDHPASQRTGDFDRAFCHWLAAATVGLFRRRRQSSPLPRYQPGGRHAPGQHAATLRCRRRPLLRKRGSSSRPSG